MKKLCLALSVLVLFLFIGQYALAQQTDYEDALAAYMKRDYGAAVERLKEYVSQRPEARAYYLLGYASYALNKDDEASGYFKEAYLIDPEFDPGEITAEFKKMRP
jgi:TolA-binding protein